MNIVDLVHVRLLGLQDLPYKQFYEKLIPTVLPETVLGVRTPLLRKMAKELQGRRDFLEFIRSLPHKYYEENNLHAFWIGDLPDYETCLAALEHFLPYVDNWATCDSLRPKCFKKYRECFLPDIKRWIASDHEYTVRFAIEMLMVWFLDDAFRTEYPEWVASVSGDAYYIKMMQAWYFATALDKKYQVAIRYLEENKLSEWVHNKCIQKAIESRRIPEPQKAYLRQLKR